jgi:hypothetical protein
MNDVPGEDLLQHLYRVVSFIDIARAEGGKVRVLSVYACMYIPKYVYIHTYTYTYTYISHVRREERYLCVFFLCRNQGVLAKN